MIDLIGLVVDTFDERCVVHVFYEPWRRLPTDCELSEYMPYDIELTCRTTTEFLENGRWNADGALDDIGRLSTHFALPEFGDPYNGMGPLAVTLGSELVPISSRPVAKRTALVLDMVDEVSPSELEQLARLYISDREFKIPREILRKLRN